MHPPLFRRIAVAGLIIGLTSITLPPAAVAGPRWRPTDATTRTVDLGAGHTVTLTRPNAGPAMLLGQDPELGLLVADGPQGTVIGALSPSTRTEVLDERAAPVRPPRGTTLDLSAVARDGRATAAIVMLFDVRTGRTQVTRNITADGSGEPCSTKVFARSNCAVVPAGVYAAMAYVWTMPYGVPSEEQPRTVQSLSLVGPPKP